MSDSGMPIPDGVIDNANETSEANESELSAEERATVDRFLEQLQAQITEHGLGRLRNALVGGLEEMGVTYNKETQQLDSSNATDNNKKQIYKFISVFDDIGGPLQGMGQ